MNNLKTTYSLNDLHNTCHLPSNMIVNKALSLFRDVGQLERVGVRKLGQQLELKMRAIEELKGQSP